MEENVPRLWRDYRIQINNQINNPDKDTRGHSEVAVSCCGPTCRVLDVMQDVEQAEEEFVPSAHHEQNRLKQNQNRLKLTVTMSHVSRSGPVRF